MFFWGDIIGVDPPVTVCMAHSLSRKENPMTDRSDPSALRWLIGAELKNFRTKARLTLATLSEKTGIVRAKLGHMESGRYTQFPSDIRLFLTACGASETDIDRLSSLSGKTDEKAWWAPYSHILPDWNRTYVGLEGMASRLFTYEPAVIPGLLQIPEYAEALTEAVGFVRSDQAGRFVEFRQARAERLFAENNPLELHAVIEEGALRRKVGDHELMLKQYDHLHKMAERDNITIQIACPIDGPHAAGLGQFTLLDFPMAQSIAFTELLDGAVYAQDRDTVATYRMVAENLERVAQTPDKSRVLFRQAESQFWK
jgi:transcriptional regulator with XRE-family HTH domain